MEQLDFEDILFPAARYEWVTDIWPIQELLLHSWCISVAKREAAQVFLGPCLE